MKSGLILWALLCCGCATRPGSFDRGEPGHYRVPTEQTYRGQARTYLADVPRSYHDREAVPLVVCLHGAFSTARLMRERTGFSLLGEEEQFVTVYPNGIGRFGFLQHWNAEFCCGRAQRIGIDDEGFVLGVIDDVTRTLNIDRVYLVGFSNGGMLAQLLAAKHPQRFAAVGLVSTSLGVRGAGDSEWRRLSPATGPVPMMIVHGLADQRVPFAGGKTVHPHDESEYLPVADMLEYWLVANQLERGDPVDHDGSNWSELRYASGRDDSEVRLVVIDDAGHHWPGEFHRKGSLIPWDFPPYEATTDIWHWFSRVLR